MSLSAQVFDELGRRRNFHRDILVLFVLLPSRIRVINRPRKSIESVPVIILKFH